MSGNSHAGYKGKVKIDDKDVCGLATWAYSGHSRAVENDTELGDDHATFTPLTIEGGEITLTGLFFADEDEGQQLLESYFDSAENITNIKLYVDESDDLYYELDSNLTPASYATVTKCDDAACDKAGLVSISATLKVSGKLKLNKSTTSVAVETLGSINVADVTATLLGELTSLGEEASVGCYFEYGLTTSYGTDTSASKTTMSQIGLFDNDLTGLTPASTYHYRAVALLDDTSKVVGKDKTFITES